MAKIPSVYDDRVFATHFPSGAAFADLLDNFMRFLIHASTQRMDDEHFWRFSDEEPAVGDPAYNVHYEGKHRPASARVYEIQVTPALIGNVASGFPEIPSIDSFTDDEVAAIHNTLYRCMTGPEGNQWTGSVWYLHERLLRPLITRLRGRVNMTGEFIFEKDETESEGKVFRGVTVDSGIGSSAVRKGSIVVKPHIPLTSNTKSVIAYPIRVGNFTQEGDYVDPVEGRDEALTFDFGNSENPDKNSVRVHLSRHGLEFITSGPEYRPDPEDEDAIVPRIIIDGIDLRNHDHSHAPYMGTPIGSGGEGATISTVRRLSTFSVTSYAPTPTDAYDWIPITRPDTLGRTAFLFDLENLHILQFCFTFMFSMRLAVLPSDTLVRFALGWFRPDLSAEEDFCPADVAGQQQIWQVIPQMLRPTSSDSYIHNVLLRYMLPRNTYITQDFNPSDKVPRLFMSTSNNLVPITISEGKLLAESWLLTFGQGEGGGGGGWVDPEIPSA